MRYLVLVFIALTCIPASLAITIGISPGTIEYAKVLEEGYAERTVTITTNTDQRLFGSFKITGDVEEWLRFSPDSRQFNTSRNTPYKLTIIVEPPQDIPNGNFTGQIEFITDSVGDVSGRAGGIVKASVILQLAVEIVGDQIIECTAGAFAIKDTEVASPIEISMRVENDGNVRLQPTVQYDIWDQLQQELVLTREFQGKTVFPTTQESISRLADNPLSEGQYWANIEVEECETSDVLTFSVFERGAIVDKGEFSGIFNKPEISIGETVQFTAAFVNRGRRAVTAQFKGAIRLNNKIVDTIESDEIIVQAGTTEDIPILYTPTKPGKYVLSGRINFNNKLTFEKSSTLEVEPPEGTATKISLVPLLIFVIIVVSILFILRMIIIGHKKKRRRF